MRSLSIALVAVLSLTAAAGCSNDEEAPPEVAHPWPLTGVDGYPEGDTRQTVTVKIENTEAGRPQLGVGMADVVVQELVEGGLTRLAVMFHSQYPDKAGPVRSMRETDIGLVLPTGGTLAASGGADSTVAAIEGAGVPVAVEGDTGFSRDSSRSSPYNVMLNVAELAASLPASPPPGPYLPFGDLPEGAEGTPAASIDMSWPGSESSFAYDAATNLWARTDLDDAADFSFTNVIALIVPVTYDGETDAAGTPIPTMVTTGSGTGYVATAGEVFQVGWSKASNSAPWKLTYLPQTEDGESAVSTPFTLPAGRTWISLLPEDGGDASLTPPVSPAPSP